MTSCQGVAPGHDVIRAVQLLALPAVRENGNLAVLAQSDEAPFLLLADEQPPVLIEGEPVGIARRLAKDRLPTAGRPPVNSVPVNIAEQEKAFGTPNRSLRELEAVGYFFDNGRSIE